MNSQTLGALSSDQKIKNVFHAFGYSIPVGKDGRRLWPTVSVASDPSDGFFPI